MWSINVKLNVSYNGKKENRSHPFTRKHKKDIEIVGRYFLTEFTLQKFLFKKKKFG